MQREFQRFSSIIPQHFLRVIMAQHGKWRNPAILIINDVGCYVRQTIDLDGIPQYLRDVTQKMARSVCHPANVKIYLSTCMP